MREKNGKIFQPLTSDKITTVLQARTEGLQGLKFKMAPSPPQKAGGCHLGFQRWKHPGN